jgi:hypothetical protein
VLVVDVEVEAEAEVDVDVYVDVDVRYVELDVNDNLSTPTIPVPVIWSVVAVLQFAYFLLDTFRNGQRKHLQSTPYQTNCILPLPAGACILNPNYEQISNSPYESRPLYSRRNQCASFYDGCIF